MKLWQSRYKRSIDWRHWSKKIMKSTSRWLLIRMRGINRKKVKWRRRPLQEGWRSREFNWCRCKAILMRSMAQQIHFPQHNKVQVKISQCTHRQVEWKVDKKIKKATWALKRSGWIEAYWRRLQRERRMRTRELDNLNKINYKLCFPPDNRSTRNHSIQTQSQLRTPRDTDMIE